MFNAFNHDGCSPVTSSTTFPKIVGLSKVKLVLLPSSVLVSFFATCFSSKIIVNISPTRLALLVSKKLIEVEV